jgi:uncharacterized membrane protein
MVAAGAAGGVVLGGTFGQILAFVLISVGLVLATGLVFLEVGLSEDREREREQAEAREREAVEREREAVERERERHGRIPPGGGPRRLDRLRGRRRRLR